MGASLLVKVCGIKEGSIAMGTDLWHQGGVVSLWVQICGIEQGLVAMASRRGRSLRVKVCGIEEGSFATGRNLWHRGGGSLWVQICDNEEESRRYW